MGIPELFIVVVLFASLATVVWPASRICKRVGFSPWLGLLILVPLANIFLLWFVAFSRWPAVPPSDLNY